KRQATAAIAQRLGAQALIEPRLDRALLLAREGAALDDSIATRSNLLAALLRRPAAIALLHVGGTRVIDDALTPEGGTLAVRSDGGHRLRSRRPHRPHGRGHHESVRCAGRGARLQTSERRPRARAFGAYRSRTPDRIRRPRTLARRDKRRDDHVPARRPDLRT